MVADTTHQHIEAGALLMVSAEHAAWFKQHGWAGSPIKYDWPVFVQSGVYWHGEYQEWCVKCYQQSEQYGGGGMPIPVRFLTPQGQGKYTDYAGGELSSFLFPSAEESDTGAKDDH